LSVSLCVFVRRFTQHQPQQRLARRKTSFSAPWLHDSRRSSRSSSNTNTNTNNSKRSQPQHQQHTTSGLAHRKTSAFLQQMLSSMPPEALMNVLREQSRTK
jgi:hypothetical protein